MSVKVSDEIALSLGRFFTGGVGPTHRQLTQLFAGRNAGRLDPRNFDDLANKETRVVEVLTRAPEELAGQLVDDLLARLRVWEAFRPHSANYAGHGTLATARSAFARQGWHLDNEGHLAPTVLGDVRHADRRPAIEAQIARVRNAPSDAALLMGTAKELLEAAGRYVLEELDQPARDNADFGEVMYMARARLGLLPEQAEASNRAGAALRQALGGLTTFTEGVNALRNAEGTGHGRARLPGVPAPVARAVVAATAPMCDMLLETLDSQLGRLAA